MRPFRESDLDAYAAMLMTPEVQRWLHIPPSFDRDLAWQQMAVWLGQWELRGTGQWALEEKTTGAFVGRAGLHRPEREDWPGIECGWTLHPQHWGKGYATEAGAASVEYAFAHHDVDALYSIILHENIGSQNVARRLGFEPWEERLFKFFPEAPHKIWRRGR